MKPAGPDNPHERWRHRLNRRMDSSDYRDEWYAEQCLHCRFYVPLDGQLGEDYGACINPFSAFDGRVMFEHDGCEAFEEAADDNRAGEPDATDQSVAVPREQLLRLARLLNLLVVSGDRLGSHFGEQRLDELDHELGRWFRESGVWPQLSEARGELHDRLADDTTEGDAKLAQELAELPYWRPAQ